MPHPGTAHIQPVPTPVPTSDRGLITCKEFMGVARSALHGSSQQAGVRVMGRSGAPLGVGEGHGDPGFS